MLPTTPFIHTYIHTYIHTHTYFGAVVIYAAILRQGRDDAISPGGGHETVSMRAVIREYLLEGLVVRPRGLVSQGGPGVLLEQVVVP